MPEWNVPGYAELRTLGSGSFGEVVLARHDASGTLVAIKYLRHELLADAEFAEMFRGEATVLASLDEENIVRLYEYVESPSGAAIVMELIDGVSLREILSRQGGTTAEAALVVLEGSLLGLAAAHQRSVVHRDYKPENVLVNGEGISKLTDFGIAARAGDRPVPAGTLLYAPPEQIAGAPASPASDVYAATATFYECLIGRPPFSGKTSAELMRQHRSEQVPLEPVPEPLRPLVAAGMAKEPENRPADASVFVAELTTAASGAYGRNWQERGRSHLGEAALALAALWPSGGSPAVQGSAVDRINLSEDSSESLESRHLWHLRHLRHLKHLRVIAAAAAAVAVLAAGTALAAAIGFAKPSSSHYSAAAAVHSVSLPLSSSGSSTSVSAALKSSSPKPSAAPASPASPSSGSSSSSLSPSSRSSSPSSRSSSRSSSSPTSPSSRSSSSPPPSPPAVTGVSPSSGTTAGGTVVTITGTGLAGATGVSFGGVAGTITAHSSTQITVTSPPGQGTVNITVTTSAGTSAVTAADQFTYIAGIN